MATLLRNSQFSWIFNFYFLLVEHTNTAYITYHASFHLIPNFLVLP